MESFAAAFAVVLCLVRGNSDKGNLHPIDFDVGVLHAAALTQVGSIQMAFTSASPAP